MLINTNGPATLVELLRDRAVSDPERSGFLWITDDEGGERKESYSSLDVRARAVASWLRQNVSRGDRVALLFDPGLDFLAGFFGCLYAGAIAVPAYGSRARRDRNRIESIVRDCRPAVALTSGPRGSQVIEFAKAHGVRAETIGAIPDELANDWQYPDAQAQELAYLQYTSGSTTTPRGVMVSHHNVLANLRYIAQAGDLSADAFTVSWLPHFHDMGLVYGLLLPLYVGCPAGLFSYASFVQKPLRWLDAISRYRATHSGGPNSAYELCMSRIAPRDREHLDLSSWRVAFSGAEPLKAATLNQFTSTFAVNGFRRSTFYPVYGLAEATLKVTSPRAGNGYRVVQLRRDEWLEGEAAPAPGGQQEVAIVGCGRADGEHTVRIVNPDTREPCQPRQVGEIWVQGPSVAAGYWERVEETAEIFGARLANGEGPYLRTGDLGFADNDELFIAGRLKDCIIIRGQNHYPQDIEETVRQAHAALNQATVAAFAVEMGERESFAVIAEAPRGSDPSELVEPIRRAIGSEHQLQPARIVVVPPNTIPRTSSGKVRRRASREALAAGSFRLLAESRAQSGSFTDIDEESSAAEEKTRGFEDDVAACAARVLTCARQEITADQNLGELGLDSLRAAELTNALHTSFGVTLEILDVLECGSVRQIAGLVARGPGGERAVTALPETEFPLSGGQSGLWFLSQLAPESSAYQIARAIRIKGRVDAARLDKSFVEIVRRHPALRTSFHEANGSIVQRVADAPMSIVQVIDTETWDESELQVRLAEVANRPFALGHAPLLRVCLYQRDAGDVLLLVIHHLVCDLWSLDVLLEELGMVYASGGSARDLQAPAHTFADFVRAERVALKQAFKSWRYWEERLAGELPVLRLSEGRRQSSAIKPAGHLRFSLPADTAPALKRLAAAEDGTLHTLLLAIFQLLLHRYTWAEEVIVGTPTLGRHWPEFADVAGCFVNTLPIRTRFDGNASFDQLHGRVRDAVRAAGRHSLVPFPSLVEQLTLNRDAAAAPVYQAMFTFQRQRANSDEGVSLLALGAPGKIQIGKLEAETLPLIQGMAQFDLALAMAEVAGELQGTLEYDAQVFDASDMSAFVEHFKRLVEAIAADGSRPVNDYDFLTVDERTLQLKTWNDTERQYDGPDCLHTLFEQQARLTPSRRALIFADQAITYQELNERAEALATILMERGVGGDSIVAVCLERSPELVYTLLGILKAGAAYLPLDTDGPVERWQDMLSQSGAELVVGSTSTESKLRESPVPVILAEWATTRSATTRKRVTSVPDNLAYVIFTSGSTGRPKGVAVTHRGIANRLKWMQERFSLSHGDVVLQKTPASFDVSVWEFFWPLLCGATLAIARAGGHRDPAYLADIIQRHGVTTAHFVPSMLRVFLDEPAAADCFSLRHIICSGEALTLELALKTLSTCAAELHNLYGPTEASVDVTAWQCDGQETFSVPIGQPIANMRTYILDPYDQLVPASRTGMLHLAGVGLARGYINHPALTAERFVPDPYAQEPGARMYRTGDLARYREDGAIEFLGRRDQQVKIRGFRVELAEIEHRLAQHPSVKECVVDLQGAAEDPKLVTFFVPAELAEPDTSALRSHLRKFLPDYMIPAAFVTIEQMPISVNGKLDRKALPQVGRERFCVNEYTAPRTPVEQALAALWSELLEVPGVGVHDNFFELGGHSLLVTRMMNRLREEFGIDLPLLAFFEGEPTVAAVAEKIEAEPAGAGDMDQRHLETVEAFNASPQTL
jgi:amino acid adenylation domain-containing protein